MHSLSQAPQLMAPSGHGGEQPIADDAYAAGFLQVAVDGNPEGARELDGVRQHRFQLRVRTRHEMRQHAKAGAREGEFELRAD